MEGPYQPHFFGEETPGLRRSETDRVRQPLHFLACTHRFASILGTSVASELGEIKFVSPSSWPTRRIFSKDGGRHRAGRACSMQMKQRDEGGGTERGRVKGGGNTRSKRRDGSRVRSSREPRHASPHEDHQTCHLRFPQERINDGPARYVSSAHLPRVRAP